LARRQDFLPFQHQDLGFRLERWFGPLASTLLLLGSQPLEEANRKNDSPDENCYHQVSGPRATACVGILETVRLNRRRGGSRLHVHLDVTQMREWPSLPQGRHGERWICFDGLNLSGGGNDGNDFPECDRFKGRTALQTRDKRKVKAGNLRLESCRTRSGRL